MKKLLALLLAVILVLSLAACTSTAKDDEPASDASDAAKLTMATEATFPPYEYYDGDAIVGIDVEVAQAIAEKLGMELEVTDIAFDSIIPGIQTGKYDMGMAGMTVTDERKEQVSFSDSYATGVQVVIVRDGSAITSVDDLLAGRRQHRRRHAGRHHGLSLCHVRHRGSRSRHRQVLRQDDRTLWRP